MALSMGMGTYVFSVRKKQRPEDIPALDDAAYESVLSTDWHPFYDARGVSWLED